MLGPRICLLQVYDWQENAAGDVTVTKGDPFYDGGWTTTIEAAGQEGYLTIEGGFTHYTVSQLLRVDYSAGTVTLEVTDDPIDTLTGTMTTVSDTGTITVDSTQYFYVVNEAWLVDGAALSDVKGEILEDGSIHIAGGFAYYIETVKKTTIRTKDGQTQVVNDETKTVSRLYPATPGSRGAQRHAHEFVGVEDGQRHVVDVHPPGRATRSMWPTSMAMACPRCTWNLPRAARWTPASRSAISPTRCRRKAWGRG